jgi:uncharacterized protein DUF222/HNH endonuclease
MYRPTDPPPQSENFGGISVDRLTVEHLEHELCELAAQVEAGMARWIALVGAYDRRGGWSSWRGVRSTAEWIAWRCSCSPRAAREHVRVARALHELPLTREAFGRGELSYSKVRSLTRVATGRSEEFLLHQARYATASQLDRMLSAYRRTTDEEANAAHDERELSWHWCSDGSLQISARLPAEDGRAFLDALGAARAQIREEAREVEVKDGPAGPRRADELPLGRIARNADALSLICESFARHGPTVRTGAERQQLIVHVDADTLVADVSGRSGIERGPRIARQAVRRLGCDASLQALVKRGRRTLYVGRKTRAVSPALHLAVRERDRCCRFPGCDNHQWVDAHHIIHWADGGETSLDNLVLLCRRHHRLVHEGGFSVEQLPSEEVVFRDPRGRRLRNSSPASHTSVSRLCARNREAGLEIGPDTLLIGSGERMDLAPCVDAVADACA